MSEKSKTPWKNGFYYNEQFTAFLQKVDGNKVLQYSHMWLDFPDAEPMGPPTTRTYGDFGPAHEEVSKVVGGIKNYNVEFYTYFGILQRVLGIISEDGKSLYFWGMANSVEVFRWISDEGLKKLAESREPSEAPSCPYKIQPQNQGKMVWLSGPPGAGKSTTALLMGKENGFVFWEADCTMNGLNPFLPVDTEHATRALMQQPPLKGVSRELYDSVVTILKEFQKLSTGNFDDVNWELAKPFTYNVAKCIGEQKKRLGGNFVAAQAINSRDLRDVVRKVLPGSIFITLTLTKENQMKRIYERHGEASSEMIGLLTKMFEIYEGPGEGEPNTFNIDITVDMTPNDVKEKVMEILEKNCN